MTSASDSTLFNSTFRISSINPGKYDRVARIAATSSDSDSSAQVILTLDINTELYPLSVGDSFDMCIASTLNLDGSKDTDHRGFRDVSRSGPGAIGTDQTLADSYDYVMFGKVYRFDEGEGENIKMYASFGGLLLYMDGPYKRLTPLRIDYIYLLMKK